MIVEVVAVGTELLLGQLVNSNAATIGSVLAEHGFDAHYQQVVGDNQARIEAVLRTAMSRADAVIVTGGIGPTQDDLTREAISAATGRRLTRDDGYAALLRERFEAMGREFPASNLRQADLPEGAQMLPNPKGTAPGIALRHDEVWIFAVPGVPEEMEHLLEREIVPRLRAAGGEGEVLLSRLLRTWGRSEAGVAEQLDDLYTGSSNPSVAFLASSGEIKIRITAKAPDEETARRMIQPVEETVRERLGPGVFGADDESIEPVLLRELESRRWSVATAESATGGLVVARLTAVPGASRTVVGSVVAYTQWSKEHVLGVPAEVLRRGLVTGEAALAMASGARKVFGADVGVSVTGSAGPEPQEQPPGTMIIGVETPENAAFRVTRLPGDRERVRTYAATAALQLARLAVTGVWWSR